MRQPDAYYTTSLAKARHRFGILRLEAGVANRLGLSGSNSQTMNDFASKMSTGFQAGILIGAMWTEHWGAAARIEMLHTQVVEGSSEGKANMLAGGIELLGQFPFEKGGRSHFYTMLGLGFANLKETWYVKNAGFATYLGGGSSAVVRLGAGLQLHATPVLAFHFGGMGAVGIPVSNSGVVPKVSRIGGMGGIAFAF